MARKVVLAGACRTAIGTMGGKSEMSFSRQRAWEKSNFPHTKKMED